MEMLALSDADLKEKLKADREAMRQGVLAKDKAVGEELK